VRRGVLAALESAPDYIGFWDADLATPLADIESFCRVLDVKPEIAAVIGTRIRLLGHKIERQPARYVLGRLFARVASTALGLGVFDTQCGAKLFRATPQMATWFARPFLARWIFDVEILARMKRSFNGRGEDALAEAIYEHPLDAWRDVRGSTLKRSDFAKAIAELARIYWTYLRPGAKGLGPESATSAPQIDVPVEAGSSADRQRAA
jgi:hypothetical protein